MEKEIPGEDQSSKKQRLNKCSETAPTKIVPIKVLKVLFSVYKVYAIISFKINIYLNLSWKFIEYFP